MSMEFRRSANEEDPNHEKDTLFCIAKSYSNFEEEKKQKFLDKLNFSYSLQKINKEKLYGRMISTAAQMYPKISNQGNKYAAQQYSAASIRQNRRNFIEYMQQPFPEHKEEIKRYTHILSKKKQQAGGLDSFWMFKKDLNTTDGRKKKNANHSLLESSSKNEQISPINKTEQAYIKILAWGKLSTDIKNSLISKNLLKNYVANFIGENFALWFVTFYQIKSYINFNEFQNLVDRFKKVSLRESHLVSFFLYDQDGDRFISPKDVFGVFERQLNLKIEKDVLKIAKFVKENIGKEDEIIEKFKIEHVIIKDNLMTLKDYEMFFKKVDEPYLKATNKKDTVFSKTFAVLDHRQKVRSTRRQITQVQHMYSELFGEITKVIKNFAFIDQNDYKLSYSFFYEIFKQEKTAVFTFFSGLLFGI